MQKIKMTKEGVEKLQKELEDLISFKRPENLKRLHTARSMGDLRENSEYTAAKEEQSFVESRIVEIEHLLKYAEIVEEKTISGVISIGSKVTVELKDKKRFTYIIVNEHEADPVQKKLSNTSPIGEALIGKKNGDTVEIDVPAGKVLYNIVSIE